MLNLQSTEWVKPLINYKWMLNQITFYSWKIDLGRSVQLHVSGSGAIWKHRKCFALWKWLLHLQKLKTPLPLGNEWNAGAAMCKKQSRCCICCAWRLVPCPVMVGKLCSCKPFQQWQNKEARNWRWSRLVRLWKWNNSFQQTNVAF